MLRVMKRETIISKDAYLHAMAKKYHVLIEQDEDGTYIGRALGLKGCVTQGDTVDDLMQHMKEAIELYLETEQSSSEETHFIDVQQLEVS